jgi:murein DD-endopeptidase MepM/ murein hydrolase activator NlpD
MAGFRPTPRDSASIRDEAKLEAEEPQVIPLHGRLTPASPPPAPRSSGPTERRTSVPMNSRPWQLLVVPPTPGAPTRAFNIKRWQAKLAAWSIGLLVCIAIADVIAVVVTVREQKPAPSDAEVAALRTGLLALEDSIAVARSSLAQAEVIQRDSVAALGIAVSRERVAQLTARRRALLAKGEESSLSSTSAALPDNGASSIEGLPVIGAIASGFSYARKHPILPIVRPHLGVDVAARYGSRISAPAAGTVTFVGRRFAYGLVVEMEHFGGITTRYAHCSAVLVKEGQHVPKGALIATVGSSGLTTGPHLHYEILRDGRQMDPTHFHFPQPDSVIVAR